ncbi:MAG: DUF4115 domain-containing protein [Acidimicrobiales bacterium]
MVVLGAVVVAAVAVVAIGLVARRRAGTEVGSVEGYRHTLSTLEGIRSRADQSGVRIGEGPPAEGRSTGPLADRLSVDGGTEGGGRRDQTVGGPGRLVFDDALSSGRSHGDRGARRPAAGPVQLTPRGQHRALSAMNHGPRRVAGPVLVALIVLGLVGVVVEIGLHQRHPKPAAAHGRTTASAGHTTGTVRSRGAGGARTSRTGTHTSGRTAGTGTHHRRTPTTTTPTTPTSFAAANVTANGATYAVPAGSYSLSLATTNGPCWILVTDSAGSTVFTETMPPGSRHRLTASGALQVELGAPGSISVEVDSRPLVLPNGYQSPFTMSVQPAG